jgi:hypothetical protein
MGWQENVQQIVSLEMSDDIDSLQKKIFVGNRHVIAQSMAAP